jgi:hypothetical protein
MLLLKVVADEGHLNLDVAERAREVLPQLTIFCNKQDPKIKDFFFLLKKKRERFLVLKEKAQIEFPFQSNISCCLLVASSYIMMKQNTVYIFLLHLLHTTEQQAGQSSSEIKQQSEARER